MRAGIKVEAVYPGKTIPDSNTPTTYEYKVGEIGTVVWKWHPNNRTFLEPVVCWDNDPTQQQRRFMFNDVLIIGLQNSNLRVTAEFAKRA